MIPVWAPCNIGMWPCCTSWPQNWNILWTGNIHVQKRSFRPLCTQQMHSINVLSVKALNIYPVHVNPPLPKYRSTVRDLPCICDFACTVLLERNACCTACWRNTDICTWESEILPDRGKICGSFAWISTKRFGPWDGNRPWSFTKVLQSSLFPLLFSFKYDDWSCLDAELIWTKNKYLLKMGSSLPGLSESLLRYETVYCFWCWFSRLVFNLCELWNTDFTVLTYMEKAKHVSKLWCY